MIVASTTSAYAKPTAAKTSSPEILTSCAKYVAPDGSSFHAPRGCPVRPVQSRWQGRTKSESVSDRVSERRRAAQLARHYCDQENLTIAEIAQRLGRAEATVKAYLYDPSYADKRPTD